jgi:hypothetical protein
VQFFLHPLRVADGRGEGDDQLVRAALERLSHVEPIAAMHVERLGDELAVQLDPRDRVEAVEDQVDALVRKQLVVRDEGRAILPVGVADPLELVFVEILVRVSDERRAQQVRMNASRHARVDGRIAQRRRHFRPITHRPNRPMVME